MPRVVLALAATALVVAACSDEDVSSPTASKAKVVAASLLPTNVIGAAITFTVGRADSARVRYWRDGDTVSLHTPANGAAAGASGDVRRLLLLGLRPTTAYRGVVETLADRVWLASDTFTVRTEALPPTLVPLRVAYTGVPHTGYLVTSYRGAGQAWIVVFDSTGQVAWYQGTPDLGGVGVASPKANGNYIVYTGGSSGWQPVSGEYREFRPDGSQVRSFTVAPPLYVDNHELEYQLSDTTLTAAYFSAYTVRTTDLSSIGRPDTTFAYHRVMRWTPTGGYSPLLADTTFFTIADRIEPPAMPPYDLAHPNSIAVAPDGDIVVSWRNTGEVMKVDPATGVPRWRLGGPHPTLTIVGDPLSFFSGQHTARMTSATRLLMMDNGIRHTPPVSRAAEYEINTTARTATLVWSFIHPKRYFSQFSGLVQRLPSGNTLVYYSTQSLAVEVAPDGSVLSEGVLLGSEGLLGLYRATAMQSLYGPSTR